MSRGPFSTAVIWGAHNFLGFNPVPVIRRNKASGDVDSPHPVSALWTAFLPAVDVSVVLPESMVQAWEIAVIVTCILLSGTFSGLTLGLMSLDIIDLRVLTESGSPTEKKYAQKILPVRRHGNFLLCTLLIGNTAVNSALSIVSSSIFGGLVGLFSSTFVILYMGEIIPQSICHRYGLIIGAYSIPMVKVLMALTAVLSYPTSIVLDYFLGGEPATRYNKSQLRSLLNMHGSAAAGGRKDETEGGVGTDPDAEEYDEVLPDSEYVVLQPEDGPNGVPALQKAPHISNTSLAEVLTDPMSNSARRRKRMRMWGRLRRKAGGENGVAGLGGTVDGELRSHQSGGSAVARSVEGADDDEGDAGKGGSRGRTPKKDRGGDKRKEKEKEDAAPLTSREMTLLDGAFQFAQKKVASVMTVKDEVFMLNADMLLNFDNLSLIFQSGHSRIPVYEGTPDQIFGVLFAKDLILLDPEDCVPVRYVLSVFDRTLLLVYDTTPLDEMLNIFKRGGGHLALVQRVIDKGTPDQKHETLGVCTLEDLIEELIGEDIVDETDVYTDNVNRKRVRRMRLIDPKILKTFDHKKSEERLSEKEGKVVAAYLAAHFDAFSPEHIDGQVLLDLLFEATIVEYPELEENEKEFLGAQGIAVDEEAEEVLKVEDEDEVSKPAGEDTSVVSSAPELRSITGTSKSTNEQRLVKSPLANGLKDVPEDKVISSTIYKRGVETQDAFLVISGRVEITAGDDGFLSEAGPWTLLGMKALTDEHYVPDFTARVSERPSRILCMPRRLYRRHSEATPATGVRGASLPPVVVGRRTKSRGRDLTWGELGNSQRTTEMLSDTAGVVVPTEVAAVAPTSSEVVELPTHQVIEIA